MRGNTTPTSPSSSSNTPTTPTPTPSSESVTYNYDAGVSSSDRSIIENAVGSAKSYFQSQFGQTIRSAIMVSVKATDGPFTGLASGTTVTIYTLNQGWTIVGRTQRTKIIAHELFHIFQSDVSWPRDDNSWFLEGTAEYLGYATTISGGMASYDDVKNCEVNNYFGAGGSSLPGPEGLVFGSGGTTGGYLVAWLAVDRLLNGLSGIPGLARFWQSGGDWKQAFQSAFGNPPATLYADFAQYRQTLRSSGTGACSTLNRN